MENQESASSLPVLPRIDRLDRLLQLLEEKHKLSRRNLCKTAEQKEEEEEDQCKTLSSALDEVQHKGTLIDRLSMLENKVFQLSLDMEEGNTSKSSSSTAPGSEKLDHGLESSTGDSKQENDENKMLQGMQNPLLVQDQDNTKTSDGEKEGDTKIRKQNRKAYKKWWGLLRIEC